MAPGGGRASGAGGGADVSARGWGWRHAGRAAWAVRELDLEIGAGERVLLLGASGAGKSTLISALAGVLGGADEGEDEGSLLVGGGRPEDARGRVGLLLQDPDSQVMLARVGDDVAFGCENLGVPRDEIWRRVGDALEAVGLYLPHEHPTSELSGGQKQRLALAGVLAMRPQLLLLDEPTANLDPQGVVEVRDSVARVLQHSEATFVVIEHRVEIWRHLVNRVIVLAPGGGVLADGAPDDVLRARGAELAASGVWVPEYPPARPVRALGETAAPRRGRYNDLNTAHVTHETGATRGADASGAVLLRATDLAVARAKGRPVARDLSLDVVAGNATAVTGANGSGKSTLALTLAGLLSPAGGTLQASPAFAAGAGTQPIRWRSRQLLSRIGTVFQDPEHQFLAATVRAELAVGPRALKVAQRQIDERVDELLERLRLTRLAAANPFTLSGGEKRRLSVATVLATRPQLLVLDEPTFGQDSRTWAELLALLAELLDDGTAVVAVTHDSDFVDALADREFRMPVAADAPSLSAARLTPAATAAPEGGGA
ncbi:ABC transporter ATP-binding protein [Subtercola endophyticus]|uniref:ABC transporter ATP-binding protein n=1 Tax=Subtercola endophyticus TaxID=2895559 RepID=UPI001E5DF4B8|nr:ABC transporter ATP-binding protein [Subtercola endophyticus]UFS60934.1 energy-coupling factor ABC transporter ATP-binding protein [Subtercola endophyticus]